MLLHSAYNDRTLQLKQHGGVHLANKPTTYMYRRTVCVKYEERFNKLEGDLINPQLHAQDQPKPTTTTQQSAKPSQTPNKNPTIAPHTLLGQAPNSTKHIQGTIRDNHLTTTRTTDKQRHTTRAKLQTRSEDAPT